MPENLKEVKLSTTVFKSVNDEFFKSSSIDMEVLFLS